MGMKEGGKIVLNQELERVKRDLQRAKEILATDRVDRKRLASLYLNQAELRLEKLE